MEVLEQVAMMTIIDNAINTIIINSIMDTMMGMVNKSYT